MWFVSYSGISSPSLPPSCSHGKGQHQEPQEGCGGRQPPTLASWAWPHSPRYLKQSRCQRGGWRARQGGLPAPNTCPRLLTAAACSCQLSFAMVGAVWGREGGRASWNGGPLPCGPGLTPPSTPADIAGGVLRVGFLSAPPLAVAKPS